MKYFLYQITHFQFFEQIENFTKEIEILLAYEDLGLKELVDKQIAKTKQYLSQHIKPESDAIIDLLNYDYDWDDKYYSFHRSEVDKKTDIQKEKDRLNNLQWSLRKVINYLSIIDSLFYQENTQILRSVSEKKDFLLHKLNILFGDEFYFISLLFELNDIQLRSNEANEIAEELFKSGYLILKERYSFSPGYGYAKISVKGAAYIERKNKQKQNSIKDSELDKKIDNIIEHLVKLGCGQEVIFNEIDELKELQYKLSKKSWSQLLKGKLFDLALGEIISKETASSVYEYLTNNALNLLK